MSFFPMFLQEAATTPSSNLLMTAGPFLIIILIFYIFIIRPQNKKQKELERTLNSLKKGDKVVTIGGIHGTVSFVKEGKTVVVKVDDNTKLEFNRSAIATVVKDTVSNAKDNKNAPKSTEKVEEKTQDTAQSASDNKEKSNE